MQERVINRDVLTHVTHFRIPRGELGLKVTCSECKRRIRVKPGKENKCKCGNVINPFPSSAFQKRFAEYDHSSIKEFGDHFLNGHTMDEKIEMLDFLKRSSRDPDTRKFSLLTSVEVLRRFRGTNYIDIAWSIVGEYPRDFRVRYMIANCLDLSDRREDHLEALKQRMIGTSIHCLLKKKKGELSEEEYMKILERHLKRIHEERGFLRGQKEHSSEKVKVLSSKRKDIPEDLSSEIRELEGLVGEDYRTKTKPKLTCVLDTNAISNRHSSSLFGDERVEFMAPLDVLIELSKWGRIDQVPFELDYVRIEEVKMDPPREIDCMFSKHKGLKPSHADKMVATLAFREEADAIVSNDRDLWDSGLQYNLEKNYGISLKVVRPDHLEKWIGKNT